MNKKELVELDLWGGTHVYNISDKTYYLKRHAGLFSNLTVCVYGILNFINLGFTPKNISLILTEYDNTYNFYNDLFKINKDVLDLSDFTREEIDYALRYSEPSHLGLGRAKNHVSFGILRRIIKKYYTISDSTKKIHKEILNKYNFDFDNTVFIWARKTDKPVETDVPTVDRYIQVIEENNLLNYNIILQTDDISVSNEFNDKIKFNCLTELPFSENSKGFHVDLNFMLNKDFETKYNMSKIEYLQKLISLVIIASKCKYSIIYPGNLATVIPLVKGNFNNIFSFADSKNLMI
jgi:hypothetical protein